MSTIRELLVKEIEASHQFTKTHFGAKVGDSFPELVREVTPDDRVSGFLFLNLLGAHMFSSGVKEALKADMDSSKIILDNLPAFEVPLQMLYWGIEVGRKLEREEQATMAKLTGQ